MKSKRNLFIIDDYVEPQKDAIYQTLKNKKKDYYFFNVNVGSFFGGYWG